ncbi:MAG: hypothetical protein ACP5EQ_08245 [Candidatus Cloacimonadia bacterium]
MNSAKVRAFIEEHRTLFWSIPEKDRENISLNLLVETILQYGDLPDIYQLFELVGREKVAEIFHKQINQPRCNYRSSTINYFKLYFNQNAS